MLNGVQANAKGVRVTEEGYFNEVGNVYYSPNATANTLSFAAMVDDGDGAGGEGAGSKDTPSTRWGSC